MDVLPISYFLTTILLTSRNKMGGVIMAYYDPLKESIVVLKSAKPDFFEGVLKEHILSNNFQINFSDTVLPKEFLERIKSTLVAANPFYGFLITYLVHPNGGVNTYFSGSNHNLFEAMRIKIRDYLSDEDPNEAVIDTEEGSEILL